MNRMENKLPNGMTKTEMLESLKSYTDFPEVIDEVIEALAPTRNIIISREMLNTLKEVKKQCKFVWDKNRCTNCPFVEESGRHCKLNDYPERWNLDISEKYLGVIEE